MREIEDSDVGTWETVSRPSQIVPELVRPEERLCEEGQRGERRKVWVLVKVRPGCPLRAIHPDKRVSLISMKLKDGPQADLPCSADLDQGHPPVPELSAVALSLFVAGERGVVRSDGERAPGVGSDRPEDDLLVQLWRERHGELWFEYEASWERRESTMGVQRRTCWAEPSGQQQPE